MKISVLLLLVLFLTGCSVKKVVTVPYHKLYCQRMNPDGEHCDYWATPCGKLECK